jgi:hypothetical protein
MAALVSFPVQQHKMPPKNNRPKQLQNSRWVVGLFGHQGEQALFKYPLAPPSPWNMKKRSMGKTD